MTAKKIILATLGAALIAGAAIPALAAPGRDGPGRGDSHRPGGPGHAMMQDVMFVRLLKNADTNKDGKVTKEELTARQDALFAEIDANKDGFVSRGELLDFRQAKMEEFRKNNPPPALANTDPKQQDNQKNDDQRHADRQDNHRRDRDHSAWDRHGDGRQGWGRDGDNRREARWERPRDGGMMRGGFFRMVDEDRDGKISKAEATAATDKLFARMDTNKDGVISVDDLPDSPL